MTCILRVITCREDGLNNSLRIKLRNHVNIRSADAMELVEMVDHAVEEVLQSTIDIPPNFSAFQAPEDTDVACPADSVVGSSVGSLSSRLATALCFAAPNM